MGEYFNTVTKPRIQKAVYSMDMENQKGWDNGKPISRQGTSHAFKYLRLESYEDALNNIVLKDDGIDFLNAGARRLYAFLYAQHRSGRQRQFAQCGYAGQAV